MLRWMKTSSNLSRNIVVVLVCVSLLISSFYWMPMVLSLLPVSNLFFLYMMALLGNSSYILVSILSVQLNEKTKKWISKRCFLEKSLAGIFAVLAVAFITSFQTHKENRTTTDDNSNAIPLYGDARDSTDTKLLFFDDVVYFPQIIVLLSPTDVSGNTFLYPQEVELKLKAQIKALDKNSVFADMVRLSSVLPKESDILKNFQNFAQEPKPGDKENEALGLSDAITRYVNENKDMLSTSEYANFIFLATELALFSLISSDDIETSPLALKAWNRVWTGFENISLIQGIPETERKIFTCLAASSAFIRVNKSYDSEIDNKRASDIMCCRVLYINIMDISEGHRIDAALEYAHGAKELTELAENEGLILPGNFTKREEEKKRIDIFLEANTN